MADKDMQTDRRVTMMARNREAERVKCVQGKERGCQKPRKSKIPPGYAFFKSLLLAFRVCPVCHCLYKQQNQYMAAALTPELEQPISGFTYKTGCSGRAQLSTGQSF